MINRAQSKTQKIGQIICCTYPWICINVYNTFFLGFNLWEQITGAIGTFVNGKF